MDHLHSITKQLASGLIIFMLMLTSVSVTTAEVHAEQSSFEYKKYHEHSQYRQALERRMESVSKKLSSGMVDEKTYPIPGLIETCYVNRNNTGTSDEYIPQGLCSTGDYWLITAYDAKKKNRSVIYAVDARTAELVSTITVPNKYHVGGIAYDGKRIWLTGDTSDKYKGEPFVQYIDYEDFLRMADQPLYEIRSREMSGRVYINNKPSFLECDDGILWVGTYMGSKDTREAYINGYTIIEDDKGVRLNTLMYSVISGIDSSAQGCDIEGNDLYVSSSYKGSSSRVKSSFITRYNIAPLKEGTANLYVGERENSRVEVPKMNEEILVENGTIYINFEAGSKRWKNAVINTDRILAVKKSLWGKKK